MSERLLTGHWVTPKQLHPSMDNNLPKAAWMSAVFTNLPHIVYCSASETTRPHIIRAKLHAVSWEVRGRVAGISGGPKTLPTPLSVGDYLQKTGLISGAANSDHSCSDVRGGCAAGRLASISNSK